MKYILCSLASMLFILSCSTKNEDDTIEENNIWDSIENQIIDEVMMIKSNSDSMQIISSLRYSQGENTTYTVHQMYLNDVPRLLKIEDYSSDILMGVEIYYKDDYPIFISKYTSDLRQEKERYKEQIIFLDNQSIYNSLSKSTFSEVPLFEDTVFRKQEIELASIDFQKPIRALMQKGEFEMYFDEFLQLDPQSYIIVESKDSLLNAAIFIKYADDLLNNMLENPADFERQKIFVNHYFEIENGIERMIYNGASLLD